MSKFWVVVTDGGQSPAARHADKQIALAEAERLSHKTGSRAYVLEAIGFCEPKREVTWTSLTQQ